MGTVLRAFVDGPVHPKVRSSVRLAMKAKQAQLKEVAEQDVWDLVVKAMEEKQESRREAMAEENHLEAVRLTHMDDDRAVHLYNYFDLENESPEEVDVDNDQVAMLVLDDVAKALSKSRWWYESLGPIRQVVVDGQNDESKVQRVLSHNEQLWAEFLPYQVENAWASCQKAARLAGRLLLFDWEQRKVYVRVMGSGLECCWEFPDRFLGGLYNNTEKRRVTGAKLQALYQKHLELVQAVLQYAAEARDEMLRCSRGERARGKGNSTGPGTADPGAASMESKADHLIMQFFPWAQASDLGTWKTIADWRKFQEDLRLFGDVYDVLWMQKGVVSDEKTGTLRWMSDEECTWDKLSLMLGDFKTAAGLRRKLANQRDLQTKLLRKEKIQEDSAAEVKAAKDSAAAPPVPEEGPVAAIPPTIYLIRRGGQSGAESGAATAGGAAEDGGNGPAGKGQSRGRSPPPPRKLSLPLPRVRRASEAATGPTAAASKKRKPPSGILLAEPAKKVRPPRRRAPSGIGRKRRSPQRSTSRARKVGRPAAGSGGGGWCRDIETDDEKDEDDGPPELVPRDDPYDSSDSDDSDDSDEDAGSSSDDDDDDDDKPPEFLEETDDEFSDDENEGPGGNVETDGDGSGGDGSSTSTTGGGGNSSSSTSTTGGFGDGGDGHDEDGDGSAEDGSIEEEEESGSGSDFDLAVVEEVEGAAATALSVVLPRDGERFADLRSFDSLPDLLNSRQSEGKVKLVASFRKQRSGSVYSLSQLSTAPHETHSPASVAAVQGAAAANGFQQLSLDGTTSLVHDDATFLAPGTEEYQALGLEDAMGEVTADVLSSTVRGIFDYCKQVPLNEQKAGELLGASRMAINFGVGVAGHAYQHGSEAPPGEFAEPTMMNLDAAARYFKDDCLGVIFEALGRAQEAIEECLGKEGRDDLERNSQYAGEVGRRLGKPGCEAGECLFFSLECSKSEIMRPAVDRLGARARRSVDGVRVHFHVDPQNPDPSSPYARVVMATWTVYFVCEGEERAMQLTAILCNRSIVCNRNANNRAVGRLHEFYRKGVANFVQAHGGVRYEQDGLAFYNCAAPSVISFLPNEPAANKNHSRGRWIGHAQDPDGRYRLIGAKNWSLKTVGDQTLPHPKNNSPVKGSSDVKQIVKPQSGLLYARVRTMRANPNKFAPFSALREAGKTVSEKFKFREQHAWNLVYCLFQHYICPFEFVAKCLSLVHQWDELWAPSVNDFGKEWLAACRGNGFDGKLASLFMNMVDVNASDRVSSYLKRVKAAHLTCDHKYTPEFCKGQISLLRDFALDVSKSDDGRSTIDILLKAASKTTGTLGRMVNMDKYVNPQVITNLWMWGLMPDVPAFRASECPILDKDKKHFKQSNVEADIQEQEEDPNVVANMMDSKEVKSIRAVHRAMLIVAHLEQTSEVTVENGGCEGVRKPPIPLDFVLEGMESLNLLPSEDSTPYHLCYVLWYKAFGEEERWRPVMPSEVMEKLRVFLVG